MRGLSSEIEQSLAFSKSCMENLLSICYLGVPGVWHDCVISVSLMHEFMKQVFILHECVNGHSRVIA